MNAYDRKNLTALDALRCLTSRLPGVGRRAAVCVGLHLMVGLDTDPRTDPHGELTRLVTTSGGSRDRYPDRPFFRVSPIGV